MPKVRCGNSYEDRVKKKLEEFVEFLKNGILTKTSKIPFDRKGANSSFLILPVGSPIPSQK
uniref:Uncharacterized protein n=1 Tax=Leptospira ellisii TaxID=2023197 RepID=A0A2N0B4R0_9LEPT|nr:hypothetical protein CH379_18020 [Leptospira ellisii]